MASASSKVSVLITGYLGQPVTDRSYLQSALERRNATIRALRKMNSSPRKWNLLAAFAGDVAEFDILRADPSMRDIEFAHFDQDSALAVFGKGRLEAELLAKSLQFWWGKLDKGLVLKLTAKYFIENTDQVVSYLSHRRRPLVVWRMTNSGAVDTRCFGFEPGFFVNCVLPTLRELIDDRVGMYMENAMYQFAAEKSIATPLIRGRPILSGLSGTSGIPYRTPLSARAAIRMSGWLS